MKNIKKKRFLIVGISTLAAAVAVAGAVFIIERSNNKMERYHDSWMPSDIDWTVYLGYETPAKNKGLDGDYFVIVNDWTTYHKDNDKWYVAGKIVELNSVKNAELKWVNQLYDLYCTTNKWYKGTPNEWIFDLRDGFLFETQYYSVHFYGEKKDDEVPVDYGTQSVRRRENLVYNGVIPLKKFDSNYFYTFEQWDHDLKKVTESFNTYALFARYENGSLVDVDGDEVHVGFNEDDPIKKSIVSIDIPDYIEGKPVTKIDAAAFSECSNLKSISLPSTIESIGDHAFFGCSSLSEIFIPKSVTSLSETTFSSSLTNLKRIIVEEGNPNFKDIDGVLFTQNEKTMMRYPPNKRHAESEFVVPLQVEYISSFCFADMNQSDLQQFVFPEGLKSIGTWAFKNTAISELNLPDHCELLSGNFVSGCLNLSSINVQSNDYYQSINGALYSKDLSTLVRVGEGSDLSEGITVPSSVTTFAPYSLSGTNIQSFTIPSTVTKLYSYCFSYLEQSSSIYVPSTVSEIFSRAFYSSHSLVINCEALAKPANWAVDWAIPREERADENDTGYVSQINYGVDPS